MAILPKYQLYPLLLLVKQFQKKHRLLHELGYDAKKLVLLGQ